MAMEKVLYIVRHAKSSWDSPGRPDIDRPLAERGLKNAYDMAKRMKQRGHKTDQIISSPANRALHTAIIFARELQLPVYQILINEELYMGGEDAILQIIMDTDNEVDSLMVFGHNPDFTHLANHFPDEKINNLPTCGLVRMVFDVPGWNDINRGNLVDFIIDFPKNK